MIKLKNISFFQNTETESPNNSYAKDSIFDKDQNQKSNDNIITLLLL
jgi:hypothetical protein